MHIATLEVKFLDRCKTDRFAKNVSLIKNES